MDDLNVGDTVRVKPLAAVGRILRISPRLRRAPYLVLVSGYGARGYGADELEKLPDGAALTLPPPGALVVP